MSNIPRMSGTAILAQALEREHRQIDGGIERFISLLEETGTRDPVPLDAALGGLRRHIYVEEAFLFPALREAGVVMPILVMQREHGQLWDSIDAVERLQAENAEDLVVVEACRTLLSQLESHNAKEEPVIYAQADRVVSAQASDELRRFLDSGRLPDTWVPHEW
jgi:regulator of cell morphogenesis and NO signaling